MKSLILFLACLTACTRTPPASPEEMKRACDRVAELRIAPEKAKLASDVHESDEQVDDAEAATAKTIAQLRNELANEKPSVDAKQFAKYPPAQRKQILAQREWLAKQAHQEREDGIAKAQQALATAKQKYEDARTNAAAREQQLLSEARAACLSEFSGRSSAATSCLERTQAVSDIEICKRK